MKSLSKVAKKKNSLSEDCCTESELPHPDHSEFLPRLSRVRGQVAGIEKMIGEGRYCVDILVQFRAAMAAMRAVEVSIFEKHIKHCLSAALISKDRKIIDKKIDELTGLLTRRTSL